jgi:shikimate kinase
VELVVFRTLEVVMIELVVEEEVELVVGGGGGVYRGQSVLVGLH